MEKKYSFSELYKEVKGTMNGLTRGDFLGFEEDGTFYFLENPDTEVVVKPDAIRFLISELQKFVDIPNIDAIVDTDNLAMMAYNLMEKYDFDYTKVSLQEMDEIVDHCPLYDPKLLRSGKEWEENAVKFVAHYKWFKRMQMFKESQMLKQSKDVPKDPFSPANYPEVKGFVYIIKEHKYNTYKIGKTKNLKQRMNLFGVKLPFKIEIVHIIASDDYSEIETELHKTFAEKRLEGEWFDLSDEDIEWLKSLKEQAV